MLEATDPASLDDPLARIAYITVLNRVEAAVAARRYDAVLSLVPVLPHDGTTTSRRRTGRSSSPWRAGPRSGPPRQMIDAARANRMVFPCMQQALAAGRVSDKHVRILLERTRVIDDAATLAAIGRAGPPPRTSR